MATTPTGQAPVIDRENFLALVKWRRSIRLFDPNGQVTDDQMNYILEAGRWGPSGGNYQPWSFIVVRDRPTIEATGQIYMDLARVRREMDMHFPTPGYQFVQTVPVILVVVGDPRSMMMFPRMPEDPVADREYQRAAFNIYLMSMGAVVQNMQLAAAAVGLGSAYLTAVGEPTYQDRMRALLSIPDCLETLMCMPLGLRHPNAPRTRYRFPLERLVHYDRMDPSKVSTEEQLRALYDDLATRGTLIFGEGARIDDPRLPLARAAFRLGTLLGN
jgi:nitroreductase